MKIKTVDLTGAALDWAVSAANGDSDIHPYSTDWGDGGPIIDREEISLSREFYAGRIEWAAWTPAPFRDDAEAFGYGETPLTAAMRCYVASKLGDEVEIPEELK